MIEIDSLIIRNSQDRLLLAIYGEMQEMNRLSKEILLTLKKENKTVAVKDIKKETKKVVDKNVANKRSIQKAIVDSKG